MLGALLIVLIRQSIRTLHFDQNYEWIVIGSAIILAVVIDQWSTRATARRLANARHEYHAWPRHSGTDAATRQLPWEFPRIASHEPIERTHDDARHSTIPDDGCRPRALLEDREQVRGDSKGEREEDRNRPDRKELHESGIPGSTHGRGGRRQGALGERQHRRHRELADATAGGRRDAGAAHQASGE